jgi:hypothetical protein
MQILMVVLIFSGRASTFLAHHQRMGDLAQPLFLKPLSLTP